LLRIKAGGFSKFSAPQCWRQVSLPFPATGVAGNRGADFVQHLVPSRRARRNKALDPTALLGDYVIKEIWK
jgi:hypothetical protein